MIAEPKTSHSYFRHLTSKGYVHAYRRGPVVALYNSVNMNAAFLRDVPEDEDLDLGRHASEMTRRELAELGLDLSVGWFDRSDTLAELQKRSYDDGPTTLYVLPVMACNYRCQYCQFIQEFDQVKNYPQMTKEQAKDLVDQFYVASANIPPAERDLVFFGGEPFMAPEIVEYVMRYIRDERGDQDMNFIAITNGSLVTEEMAEISAHYRLYAIVSLDGPAEANDAARVDLAYHGTFGKSVRGYRRFQKAGCKVGISAMAGTHNVHNLKESMQWLIDELDPDEMSIVGVFHPLKQLPNPYQGEAEPIIEAMVETYIHCRERGVYVDQVARRLRPFVSQRPKLKDCMACGGKLIATPFGMQGSCEYTAYLKRPQTTPQGELIQIKIPGDTPEEWNRRSPILQFDCQNCPALGVCGGGCHYNAYQLYGSLDALDENNCNQTRLLLSWMLEDLYQVCERRNGNGADVLYPTPADRQTMFGKVDPLDPSLPMKAVSRHGE
jgi:uncharacterized protein